MRVPWQSALLGKFVSEIAALLVEFLCRMLDFQARLVGNADLHTPDQIAVALPVGHAPAGDAHFGAAGRACRHFEGDFVAVDILCGHFRARHSLTDGDWQIHDDVTLAQAEFRIFGNVDLQVQIAVFFRRYDPACPCLEYGFSARHARPLEHAS